MQEVVSVSTTPPPPYIIRWFLPCIVLFKQVSRDREGDLYFAVASLGERERVEMVPTLEMYFSKQEEKEEGERIHLRDVLKGCADNNSKKVNSYCALNALRMYQIRKSAEDCQHVGNERLLLLECWNRSLLTSQNRQPSIS